MVKKIYSIIFFILISTLFFSCKTKKEISKTKIPKSILSSEKIFVDSISANSLNFNTFSARSKTDIESEKLNASFTIQLRIKKDQIIWASVTAFGAIEVARAYITPDSIKILDRVNGKYIAKDFSYVSQIVKTDIDFNSLQSLLIGSTPNQILNSNTLEIVNEETNILSSQSGAFLYRSDYDANFHLINLLANNNSESQTLTINYADFILINNQKMPQTINGKSLNKAEEIKFNLRYSKITINEELQFPFSIPKNLSDQ